MLRNLQVLESPPSGSPPFRCQLQGRAVGFAGSIQSREITSTIENQMKKKMKNDMEAGNIDWLEGTDVQVSPAPDDYPSMPRSGAAQPKGQWQTAARASRQKPWLTSNYHPKGSQKILGFQGGKGGWVERGGAGGGGAAEGPGNACQAETAAAYAVRAPRMLLPCSLASTTLAKAVSRQRLKYGELSSSMCLKRFTILTAPFC